MTRRILTRETFDHQPGVGDVQGHDPRLRFAAIFNTLSPIVGVSSAKPLVLGSGSVLQPGHYGMGVLNQSNANIGAYSSSSDVRFNSTLSDLAVVLAVNWLHGGYTERSVTLLNLSGGYYIPSILINSYYSTIEGRFAEGYSGTTLSGSFAKSVPGVVVFRRIGTALTLECRSATGAYGRYTATDTKRSVPELGAGGVGIGGGTAVAAAYIIEGSVGDDEALALLSNPWRVFKGRRLFVGGWAAGGGGGNGNATGSLPTVSLSSPAASASASSIATGALSSISLSTPAAAATGTAVASGAVASITLGAPTGSASASGAGVATGSLAAVSLSTLAATASASSVATGALASITFGAPGASASSSGVVAVTPASITLSAPAGTASGSGAAVATGSLAYLWLSAPAGTAAASSVASGALSAVSCGAPAGGATSSVMTLTADDLAAVVAAIWAQAATTPLPVDVRRMNSATVYGDGTPANKWRGYV